MKQKLQDDLKAAMKAGDKLRLMTLRGVISEITRVEKDVRRPANETEIIQVIKRERARRDEALEFARKANRDDLIAQNLEEAKILGEYLPAAADVEAVKAAITERVAAGVNQIGPLMKALRDQFGAQLDAKTASELVKQALASKS
ncbi:MAG TPA: GatB/YqeY domain-containing protein [Candidatus Binataceae bacterium]|nr:GatB/YqeY domain-containing protein [Candidatus Binataceae bacterium]